MAEKTADLGDNYFAGSSEPSAPNDGAGRGSWQSSHPVNIRFSLPLPHRRVYFTIVSGTEKRAPDRRQIDRDEHPLFTFGNFLFALGIGAAIYMAGLIGLFLYGAFIG
ncbi:MAG: hypothetical protein HQL43_00040 [Alphaproteobacteria bacterium]|jgi:hypothetical protein|nr:hypothetical protein [Alphaproteobacteria bacterium]